MLRTRSRPKSKLRESPPTERQPNDHNTNGKASTVRRVLPYSVAFRRRPWMSSRKNVTLLFALLVLICYVFAFLLDYTVAYRRSIFLLALTPWNNGRTTAYHYPTLLLTQFSTNTAPLAQPRHAVHRSDHHDYGGLEWIPREIRTINAYDEEVYHHERKHFLQDMDHQYVSSSMLRNDELNYPRRCHRNNWQWNVYSNCNTFHEYGVTHRSRDWISQTHDVKYLSHGDFRETFLFRQPKDQFVLKRSILKPSQELSASTFRKVHIEALIMERLSSSPYIVDIYGHCSGSVMVEAMAGEVTDVVVPEHESMHNRGKISQANLDQFKDLHSFNNLTITQKVETALSMALAIAELHGFAGGMIVNNDVHPDQYLISAEGQIKLNDMNHCHIMEYNPNTRSYCKFIFNAMWDYNAPEKVQGDQWSDEQSDVFQFGLNVFAIITGLWPYYTTVSETKTIQKITNGQKPYLDPRWANNSWSEGRLVEIMSRTLEFDPQQRPSIFEAVQFLRETKVAMAQHDEQRPNFV